MAVSLLDAGSLAESGFSPHVCFHLAQRHLARHPDLWRGQRCHRRTFEVRKLDPASQVMKFMEDEEASTPLSRLRDRISDSISLELNPLR
jgi:hypothetical protein